MGTVKLISNASRVLDESREIVRDVRLVEYIEGFQVYGTWSMILEASFLPVSADVQIELQHTVG